MCPACVLCIKGQKLELLALGGCLKAVSTLFYQLPVTAESLFKASCV